MCPILQICIILLGRNHIAKRWAQATSSHRSESAIASGLLHFNSRIRAEATSHFREEKYSWGGNCRFETWQKNWKKCEKWWRRRPLYPVLYRTVPRLVQHSRQLGTECPKQFGGTGGTWGRVNRVKRKTETRRLISKSPLKSPSFRAKPLCCLSLKIWLPSIHRDFNSLLFSSFLTQRDLLLVQKCASKWSRTRKFPWRNKNSMFVYCQKLLYVLGFLFMGRFVFFIFWWCGEFVEQNKGCGNIGLDIEDFFTKSK